ncbi:MAG: bifunctional UDP-N-acetylglucosamine diphosphorylase/glucosamine-1-phosphate N-acetyltransferase GlmU, partial [Promicromonosporaceae bacterium]|nr:bifunctional UDP-N-acetylglucosamine diphosphorylase/glucosamine-1-phosphate N-acetyltransferase GlmU [Promicromonosporaceae bacterium]
NDRAQLAALGKELNRRVVHQAMLDGVTVIDPDTTWIDVSVSLEADTTILPGTQLHGSTVVQVGAVVGPDSTLTDTLVGPGATANRVVAVSATLGAGANAGPFTYLRPGTAVGTGAKVGGFVEVKNSQIGDDAKVPHLSYVGDAEIGAGANLGAGTIIANYDGVKKHRSQIGRQARVGSNNVLVAPVDIGDGAYTAAGSVITDDVAPGALGIGRARGTQIDGWVLTHRDGTDSADAASAAGAKLSPR